MVEDLIAAAINDARAKADAGGQCGNAEDDERPAAAAGVQAALLSASSVVKRTVVGCMMTVHTAEAALGRALCSLAQCRIFRSASCGCSTMPSASMATAKSSRALGGRERSPGRTGERSPSDARDGAGAGAARAQARRPRRDPGDEPRPSPDRLVRRRSAMGGVLHTINPRLFDDQLTYIVNHAEDRVLLLRPGLRADGRADEAEVEDDRALHLLRSARRRERLPRMDRRRGRRLSLGRGRRARPAAAFATPAARPEIPRVCSTSIVRRCSTRLSQLVPGHHRTVEAGR